MQNKATDLFSDWAEIGRDQGMAKAHNPAVSEILSTVLAGREKSFSFIDAGCGNGWVVQKVREIPQCESACGVDGAKAMIENARNIDPDGEYYLEDLLEWVPPKKADIVHSMEVFYYFKEPEVLTKHIVANWLNPGGTLVIGLDHYIGNPDSYSWSKDLNVHMSLLGELDWIDMFSESRLSDCKSWRANSSDDFPGTLVVSGTLLS
jgi:trans-aconitate methyltransferase